MYLNLSGCCRIKKLPVSFGKLTRLVHLDFSNCYQVTYVSESVKSLNSLEYLDLSYCLNIGELSENLGSLSKLRNLNLSHSSYVCSHDNCCPNAEVLFTLTKLECLNLSSTQPRPMTIKNLPEALNRFTNLKYLNLSGLRKHWLHRREGPIAFANLKELVYLQPIRLAGLVRCWIVKKYCWLVWCERKILFWLKIYDRLRGNNPSLYHAVVVSMVFWTPWVALLNSNI